MCFLSALTSALTSHVSLDQIHIRAISSFLSLSGGSLVNPPYRNLQPHHQPSALPWLPRSERLVRRSTAPLSRIWILKSKPSEQRGGLKRDGGNQSGVGGPRPPICYGNVMPGSTYVLMMKRDMGTFWNFNAEPWWVFRIFFCRSYLSISKEAGLGALCLVFSLSSAKAAIEMLIQHALFILLHLHTSRGCAVPLLLKCFGGFALVLSVKLDIVYIFF